MHGCRDEQNCWFWEGKTLVSFFFQIIRCFRTSVFAFLQSPGFSAREFVITFFLPMWKSMEAQICENMRGQICYKADGGYFCVLTKTLSHEFDRGGNISHTRWWWGLCSKVQTQLPCSVLRNVNLFLSLLYSISVESSLGKHRM